MLFYWLKKIELWLNNIFNNTNADFVSRIILYQRYNNANHL